MFTTYQPSIYNFLTTVQATSRFCSSETHVVFLQPKIHFSQLGCFDWCLFATSGSHQLIRIHSLGSHQNPSRIFICSSTILRNFSINCVVLILGDSHSKKHPFPKRTLASIDSPPHGHWLLLQLEHLYRIKGFSCSQASILLVDPYKTGIRCC